MTDNQRDRTTSPVPKCGRCGGEIKQDSDGDWLHVSGHYFCPGGEPHGEMAIPEVSVQEQIDVLAYLITVKRFHERGPRPPVTAEDVAVCRPLAEFLYAEGYRRSSEHLGQMARDRAELPTTLKEQLAARISLGGLSEAERWVAWE